MTKSKKIIYWIATVWLSLGMFSTGMVQLVKGADGPGALNSMHHLGYPEYLMTLLAAWKFLGVIAILIPRFPLVKEWAYAGFFFLCTGALSSHLVAGDPVAECFPALLLLVLTMVSWYLRPAGRRVAPASINDKVINSAI